MGKLSKTGTQVHALVTEITQLISFARKQALSSINTLQVMTNFEIGRLIVEHEQQGIERAQYGKETLKLLSETLTTEFGKGFSLTNLKLMRQFYLMKKNQIGQTDSDQLRKASKILSQAVQEQHFSLSWSHYVFLLSIADTLERQFYEIEASTNHWSLAELKRQFNTSLYERLALSRDKKEILKLAQQGQTIQEPKDLFKEPYVLEFLGLEEKPRYSEYELESAIIDKLEHFLLELGKGFLFEARQKRFTFDDDHFFVDLVFYNRLLRCYVLIDLKIGKLAHQDLGQMQMYVNYFDRYVKKEDEAPTIGIILCKTKSDALIEITLPKESKIQAARYQLYLPDKEELKQKLMDWSEEGEIS